MPNFTAKAFEWVAEGIIDDTQAEALISYERKRTQEPRTSYLVEALIYLGAVLASLMILVAPGFLIASFWWGELFAVACAVGLIGMGIMLRQLVLLGLGGVGVFIYVPMALFEYFGDVIGVPVGLLITSVLLVGTALMLLRLGSRFRSAMVSEVARPAQVEGPSAEGPPAEGPQLEEAS